MKLETRVTTPRDSLAASWARGSEWFTEPGICGHFATVAQKL